MTLALLFVAMLALCFVGLFRHSGSTFAQTKPTQPGPHVRALQDDIDRYGDCGSDFSPPVVDSDWV